MTIKIKSYYKTTPIDNETLQLAIDSAKDQENKILKLFKQFGTMTSWDVYDVYNQLISPILMSSVNRSINTLKKQNIIESLGTVPGDMGRPINLYTIVENAPEIVERKINYEIPKSIKINVIFDKEGFFDEQTMDSEYVDKKKLLINTFNLKTK